MRFDTEIAVALRDDLAIWQKWNATAFLVSGIAGTTEIDANGTAYLPVFRQPVLVFSATDHDGANRAAPPASWVPAPSPAPTVASSASPSAPKRTSGTRYSKG